MFGHRRISLVPIALAMIVLGLVPVGASVAQTQGCTQLSPPCPTDFPPSISLFAPDTVFANSVNVGVYMSDDYGLDPSSFSVAGGGQDQINWITGFNPTSGTGSILVSLVLGQNTIAGQVCDNSGKPGHCAVDTIVVTYVLPPPPPAHAVPVADITPTNTDNRAVSACFAACLDGVLGYSTPSYRSLDTDRGVTLLYSTFQAMPMATVQVDVTDASDTAPSKMSLRLRAGGIYRGFDYISGSPTEIFYTGGNGTIRMAGRFKPGASVTGDSSFTAVVTSYWSSTSLQDTSKTIRILWVNESGSAYGAGWTVAGLQKLTADAAGNFLVTNGDGSVAFFAKCSTGCNTFVSPAGDFTLLVKDSTHAQGVFYDRRWPDGTLAKYDTLGRIASVSDRFGNTVTYAYKGLTGAAAGQLWTITDPAGKVITFAYDANGKLQTIQDPGGRVAHFTVNASGDLTDIVDPDGVKALHVTYDAHHIAQNYNDRTKSLWTLTYDRGGKVKSVVAPAVTVAGGSFQGTTAFRSVEALVLPDSAGTTGTSASPLTRQLSSKLRVKVTAPNGDSTLYALNRFGSPTLTWMKGPQGHPLVTTLQYNTNDQATSVLDTALNATSYTWSGPDLLRVDDQKAGSEQEFAYESVYHQVVADSLDHTIFQKNFLSTLGGLDSVWVDSVIVARYKYDARYRPITITDQAGHVDSITYNTTGFWNTQWMSVPTATGGRARTSLTYDGYGRLQQTTDPLSRVATLSLDSLNRTRSMTGALGITVKTGYNDTTFTSTVTDPRNLTYTTVTNALGWVVSKTDTKGGIQRWTYDSLGDVLTYTNRRNQVATFTYDHQGRLLTQIADGQTTKFAYDSLFRWTADSNAEGIDTTQLDNNGHPLMVVSIRGSSHDTLVYSYRHDGLPDKLTIQGGWANSKFNLYGYDAALRPNEITDFSENGTAIDYNGDGLESQYSNPTGANASTYLHQRFFYNSAHLLDSLNADQGLAGSIGRHYGYDGVGRDTMVARGTPSDLGNLQLGDMQIRTLTYDQADRLSGYIDRHDWDEDGGIVCPDPFDLTSCYRNYIQHSDTLRQGSFAYDSSGNWRGTGDTTEANSDRATALNGYHLTYDNDGNITQKTKTGFSQTFTWNTLGQLTQVVTVINGNSTTTTYGYNPLGQRIRKTVNGTVTRFLWDGANLAMELDGSGNPLREYTYYPGVDRPLSLRRFSDGAMFYYTAEQPGHVATLVNSSNQVVNSYAYGPFGDSLSWQEQVAQPFKFGSREYDPDSRLYYNRARYYDPALARFISEDTTGVEGGIDPYAYVNNSPLQGLDPSGLCPTILQNADNETVGSGPDAPGGAVMLGPDGNLYKCVNGGWVPFDPDTSNPTACMSVIAGLGPSGGCLAPPLPPEHARCVASGAMTVGNAALDFTGAREAYALFRSGVGLFRFVLGMAARGVKASGLNAGATVAQDAALGDMHGGRKEAGSMVLGGLAGFIPGAGTTLSGIQTYQICAPLGKEK